MSVASPARVRVLRKAAARFRQTFGERLQQARLRAGLSQSDCAHRCGITQRSLSRYETNRTEPSCSILLQLAVQIRAEPAELLGVLDDEGGR